MAGAGEEPDRLHHSSWVGCISLTASCSLRTSTSMTAARRGVLRRPVPAGDQRGRVLLGEVSGLARVHCGLHMSVPALRLVPARPPCRPGGASCHDARGRRGEAKGAAMHIHFSEAELAARRRAAAGAAAEAGFDGLLVFKQESMFYLTGYDTFGFCFFQCLLLCADGRMALLTRAPDRRPGRVHLGDRGYPRLGGCGRRQAGERPESDARRIRPCGPADRSRVAVLRSAGGAGLPSPRCAGGLRRTRGRLPGWWTGCG